jgi:hypothetical protein
LFGVFVFSLAAAIVYAVKIGAEFKTGDLTTGELQGLFIIEKLVLWVFAAIEFAMLGMYSQIEQSKAVMLTTRLAMSLVDRIQPLFFSLMHELILKINKVRAGGGTLPWPLPDAVVQELVSDAVKNVPPIRLPSLDGFEEYGWIKRYQQQQPTGQL